MPSLGELWDVTRASSELGVKRQLEGVAETRLEAPMLTEDVESPSRRLRLSYGFSLSASALLWAHMLVRLKKELDGECWATVPLNRRGTAIEGGESQTTETWQVAPGV